MLLKPRGEGVVSLHGWREVPPCLRASMPPLSFSLLHEPISYHSTYYLVYLYLPAFFLCMLPLLRFCLANQPGEERERHHHTFEIALYGANSFDTRYCLKNTQDTRCVLRGSSMGTKNERVSSRRGEARPAQPPLAPKVVYSTLSWYVA